MTKLNADEIRAELKKATSEKEIAKQRVSAKKRELEKAEDIFIEMRENEQKLKDKLQAYQNEFEIERSVEDERELEISEFKERLPAALAKIAHEPLIPPINSLTLGVKKEGD